MITRYSIELEFSTRDGKLTDAEVYDLFKYFIENGEFCGVLEKCGIDSEQDDDDE